jgi:hypothetical protein
VIEIAKPKACRALYRPALILLDENLFFFAP